MMMVAPHCVISPDQIPGRRAMSFVDGTWGTTYNVLYAEERPALGGLLCWRLPTVRPARDHRNNIHGKVAKINGSIKTGHNLHPGKKKLLFWSRR